MAAIDPFAADPLWAKKKGKVRENLQRKHEEGTLTPEEVALLPATDQKWISKNIGGEYTPQWHTDPRTGKTSRANTPLKRVVLPALGLGAALIIGALIIE